MSAASHRTNHGLMRRARQGLNVALGNGALRAQLNRGLARANLELAVKSPDDVFEADFQDFFERCAPYTMTSQARMYSVYLAARHIARAGVEGDVVECGVWRGGSSMMAALTFGAYEPQGGRRFWLYDTFEGMPRPSANDRGLHGEDAVAEWARNEHGEINQWCYAPLDDVTANMASTGLPRDHLRLVQGLVEQTIPSEAPERISLLRLDTDWYESSRHELEHLYPRLSSGGVLILDDYGHWEGVRRAVDEYLAANGIELLLTRIDYAGRMAIKP